MATSSELEERVEDLEQRIKELEELVGGTMVPAESDLEARLKKVQPGTHVERATTIGYHLMHVEGEDPFTSTDIEEAYDECRTPKPANMSDVLNGAEERGWMMNTDTRGQTKLWRVTTDGDEAVEEGFA